MLCSIDAAAYLIILSKTVQRPTFSKPLLLYTSKGTSAAVVLQIRVLPKCMISFSQADNAIEIPSSDPVYPVSMNSATSMLTLAKI